MTITTMFVIKSSDHIVVHLLEIESAYGYVSHGAGGGVTYIDQTG